MRVSLESRCSYCFEPGNPQGPCSNCGWQATENPNSALYLPPGTILKEQYQVGRILGYGGFGVLYLGWDLNLDRKLAIKEYLPAGTVTRVSGELKVTILTESSEFEYGLTQFLNEGRTLAHFDGHPNIVNVINFFREHDTAYLVMEYLDGTSLEDHLDLYGGKIPFGQALELLLPIMNALAGVHGEGLLHRDISPDNIFLLNRGGAKLIDFGAARFALGQRSRNLSVILKEGYAPPEQYVSSGRQGPWTDVYAMAATLYRAVTGELPPPSLERGEHDSLQKPERKGVLISTEMERALLKGLAPRIADRFQSIQDFQQALEQSSREPRTQDESPASLIWWQLLRQDLEVGARRLALRAAVFARESWKRRDSWLSFPAKMRSRLQNRKHDLPDLERQTRLWVFRAAGVAAGLLLLAFLIRAFLPETPDPVIDKKNTANQAQTGGKGGEFDPLRDGDSQGDSSDDQPAVPRPVLRDLQPKLAHAGSTTLQILVEGADFQPGAVVEWNRQKALQTRFLDPQRLEAIIPAADLAQPGDKEVTVFNPIPPDGQKGYRSDALTFSIRVGTPEPDPYQSLIDRAIQASQRGDVRNAYEFGRQAVQVDPDRASGWDILGFHELYFFSNPDRARRSFQEALQRGGPASFRLQHDHANLTFAQTCTGMLRIFSGEVIFESDAGHNFRIARSRVKEAKMNRSGFLKLPGVSPGDHFHIKIPGKNYNFLGTSNSPRKEADIIIDLLR